MRHAPVLMRIAFAAGIALLSPAALLSQPKLYALDSTDGLRPHNVKAEAVTFEGKKAVRITYSDEARQKLAGLSVEQQAVLFEPLAVIEGSDFLSGVIEAEVAGAPEQVAGEGARGFVGIAFRVQPDLKTYDAFYLRPTNGRAADQARRNHSAQYISHPAWTWDRLRKETPERYESYVDLVPGAWTKIRIEVRGDKARLFVHGQEQPTLIVNDVKSGPQAHGAVALWIGPGTEAHFRNLRVTSASANYKVENGADLAPDARKALDAIMAKGYPGLAVMVGKSGREVSRIAAGDLNATTPMPIASASKWLAAATVMHLVDEGKLSIDQPVSTWLSDVGPDIGKLTLRQLLSQTSGISNSQNAALARDMTLAQAAKAIGSVPLAHTPGTTFVYGGPGFQIAGAVVESATGQSWEKVFESRIAQPLGMKNTRWAHLDMSTGAPVLRRDSRNPILQGGAISTAEEYMHFLEMMASGGNYRGKRILSTEAVQAMKTDQTTKAAMTPTGAALLENAHYALGNWCESWNTKGECARNSSIGAWGVYPWIDHKSGVYGIFFANVPNDAFRVWPEMQELRAAIIASNQ